MEQDDPEKRIAELERQLGEARAAGNPGTTPGSQAPQAGMPFPAPPGAGQPYPPPPIGWQNPAPSAFPFPVASAGYRRGRSPLMLLLVAGLPILILVIVGFGVMSYVHQSVRSMMPMLPTAPSQASVGSQPSAASGASQPSAAAPTQLQTPDGLTSLLAQIRSQFGDTMGFRLVVYPDYAVLDRPDPQNSQHKQSHVYRGGSWNDFGDTEHVDSDDALVDLGKFDTAAVAARIAGAAQPLKVPNPTSTYLIVDAREGAGVSLHIYEDGNGDSGYMDINPDGSVKELHPQN
jgi:hypothetical protein